MRIVITERTTLDLNITREELFQGGFKRDFWETEEEMDECLKDCSAQGILDMMFDIGHTDDAVIDDLEIVDTKIDWQK